LQGRLQEEAFNQEGQVMNKKTDKAQDANVMKNMTPKQMMEFKSKDKKMDKDKSMTQAEDTKKDKALAEKIKAKKKK
jgi:hypothetical protein